MQINQWFVRDGMSAELRRRHVVIGYTFMLLLPVVAGAALLHLLDGRMVKAILTGALALTMLVLLVRLRNLSDLRQGFRVMAVLILATMLFGVASGADHGAAWLWVFIFPPAVFQMLGRREGGTLVVIAYLVLVPLMFADLGTYTYSNAVAIRFIAIFTVIALLSFAFESSRAHYFKALEQERDEIRCAVDEIKTLTGLLPICAKCKKIRDDKGYWNQLESYVRDHSEAEFSHGICPACTTRLYPGLMN